MTDPTHVCACGCGQPVRRPTATYLTGHHTRVKHWRTGTAGDPADRILSNIEIDKVCRACQREAMRRRRAKGR